MIDRLIKAQGRVINNFQVWFLGSDEDGFSHVWYGNMEHVLKEHYRPERTWDDHMGNTPCGTYVNLPFPGGKRERAYLY